MFRSSSAADRQQDRRIRKLRESVHPLRSPAELETLIDAVADARIVQLGVATNRMPKFYRCRTEISRHMIADHDFTFIAAEGDWPDCARVNRYVRAASNSPASAEEVLMGLERWPSWRWPTRRRAGRTRRVLAARLDRRSMAPERATLTWRQRRTGVGP